MSPAAGRVAVIFSSLGHATMHVMAALYLTIVIELERVWTMGYDELIQLWTLGALLIGLGAPLAGWLGDRWSERWMMVVFFLVTGAGAVAAGLSDGPAALWIGLAVLGIGASIYHPVGMSWVVGNAPNPGRAIGVVGIFGSIGIALAAAIAGGLIEIASWREAFILPGVASIAFGVALAGLCLAGKAADGNKSGDSISRGVARGDMMRTFIVLTVTMAAGAMVFHALSTAMPRLFEARMDALVGGNVAYVGFMVTAVYLFAATAQLVGGMLADRHPAKRIYLIGLAIQVPFLFLVSQTVGLPLLAVTCAAVFIGTFYLPAENLLLARYTPARHRGLAYGAKFVLAFGIGPIAINLIAWTFGATGGFTLLLLILTVFAAMALLSALALPGDRRQAAPVAVPAE
ncbi:MAG: MFS transporter [Azospirillaceae bacterium]